MTLDEILAQGIAHHRSGDLANAAALYENVLDLQPNHFGALYLLGVLFHYSGNPAKAVEFLCRALDVNPADPDCLNIWGLALSSLDRKDEAEAAFRSVISKDPSCEDALYNLGNLLRSRNQVAEAIKHFRQILVANANHSNALAALGQSLLVLNAPGAEVVLQQAVAASPYDAGLRCDLGDALTAIAKPREAAAEYARATEIDNTLPRPWYSVGCLQNARGAFADAVQCFRKAVALSPDWPEAKHNLAQALFELGRVEEAVQYFSQAAQSSDPELPIAMLAVAIPGSPSASNQQILEARRAWAERHPGRPKLANTQPPHRPLRIGYVSSFFARDNWMKPVWALLNRHDRAQFQLHLFSDAPAVAIRLGYRAHASDVFHDTSALTNDQLSVLIRDSSIDLLIDLNGYSNMRRLPMFASRPAPVIAGWFNMYATTGMSSFDYLIGDAQVIPPEEERFYTERILRVAGSYLTFEVSYPVPDVTSPPSSANDQFTFGCLAPLYKLTPQVIQTFCRILNQALDSQLLLKNSAFKSARNADYVRTLFEEQGIAANRLQLEGPADHYNFLETYSRIDLALDTFPYNGGTTTTEAIWQGVPVVTFYGDRWVSRTSASILRAADLSQFVCGDLNSYMALATEIANSAVAKTALASLRQNMRSHLMAAPVCDTAAFARNMEQIYRAMFFNLTPSPTPSN